MELEQIIEGESPTPKLKEREVEHSKMTNLTEFLKKFSLGEVLGTGTFGVVQTVTNKMTNQISALKTIPKFNSKGPLTDAEQLLNELTILRMVDHIHIIRLESSFECTKAYYLIFEKCGDDLSKMLAQKVRFSEKETRIVIRRLSDALAYLHDHDIVHRDLKLENILISANPSDPNDNLYIKVIDFGLGIVRKGQGYESMVEECCGTPGYMAPEILTRKNYSQQCDVWSMGVIMYFLMSGRMPFERTKHWSLMESIKKCEPKYRASTWENHDQAMGICKRMLVKDPAFRYTAAEVRGDNWTNDKKVARENHNYRGNILEMMKSCSEDIRMPLGKQCDWEVGDTSNGLSAFGDKPDVPSSSQFNESLDEICNKLAKLNYNRGETETCWSSSTEDECLESSEGDADSNDSDDPKLNWFRILEEHKRGQLKLETTEKMTSTKTKPIGKRSRIPVPCSKKPKVLGDKLHSPIVSPRLGRRQHPLIISPKGGGNVLSTTVTSPTLLRKKTFRPEQPYTFAALEHNLTPNKALYYEAASDNCGPRMKIIPTKMGIRLERFTALDTARAEAARKEAIKNRTLIPTGPVCSNMENVLRVSNTPEHDGGTERKKK